MEQGTGHAARPSRKWLRYSIYGIALLTLAVGGAILYLVVTFDPRDHHARIVDYVRNKTGRTLDISGGIELSLWPDLGMRLGALSLSERDGSAPFAAIESARLRIELEPLLKRELVVSEVVLVGARVNIVRLEDGSFNVDDLLQGEGGTPQFDIGRVAVERSSIAYRDMRSGDVYIADQLALETGRLANDAVTPFKVDFRLRDHEQKLAVSSALQGRLNLDLAARRYALEEATLELKGRVPGMDDLALRASGNAIFERATNELRLRSLAGSMAGTHGHDKIAMALNAAGLRFVPGEAYGESLHMSLVAEGAAGRTDITLASAALERIEDRVASEKVLVDVVLDRGGARFKAAIATALAAEISARELTLTDLAADISATGPRLPRSGIAGAVKGDARLDLAREGVQLELSGKLDESSVKARLTSAGFASPVYTFALDVDRLDADKYVKSRAGAASARSGAAGDRDLLAPLAHLPATGSLNVGVLTAAGTTARNVRLTLQ